VLLHILNEPVATTETRVSVHYLILVLFLIFVVESFVFCVIILAQWPLWFSLSELLSRFR